MKKILLILCVLAFLATLFAGCGPEPTGFEGEYRAVAAVTPDITLRGEDVPTQMDLSLSLGGKGVLLIDFEEKTNVKWHTDGNTITLTATGESIEGTLEDNRIVFDDFLGSGIEYIFALRGSEAENTELYIPDDELAVMKLWSSDAVMDMFEEDISEEKAPDALQLVLEKDNVGKIILDGQESSAADWYFYKGYGQFENELTLPDGSSAEVSFETADEGILRVTLYANDEYTIYLCK